MLPWMELSQIVNIYSYEIHNNHHNSSFDDSVWVGRMEGSITMPEMTKILFF